LCRAEAVLEGAKETHAPGSIALEVKDDVDEMLEYARPRHRSLLRDVSD
jgi:hypothetical protein